MTDHPILFPSARRYSEAVLGHLFVEPGVISFGIIEENLFLDLVRQGLIRINVLFVAARNCGHQALARKIVTIGDRGVISSFWHRDWFELHLRWAWLPRWRLHWFVVWIFSWIGHCSAPCLSRGQPAEQHKVPLGRLADAER